MSVTEEAEAAEHYAERGQQVIEALGWEQNWSTAESRGADAEFREFTQRMVFAQLYGRPGLSLHDRELIVMGIILTQGSERGIKPHFRRCHEVGITEREVRELIYTVCVYGGWPKGSQASVWFNKVLQEEDSSWPADMRIDPPLPPPVTVPD
jgi:4-carboxymuconolactone decarboxylase